MKQSNDDIKKKLLIVILSLLAVYSLCLYLYTQNVVKEVRQREHNLFTTLVNAIDFAIKRDVKMLSSIESFIKLHDMEVNNEHFQIFCKTITADLTEVVVIVLSPDLVVHYVYPYDKFKRIIGHDSKKDKRPEAVRAIRKTLDTGEVAYSGPYKLIVGEVGLNARKAIYNPDGSLWGLANFVLSVDKLIQRVEEDFSIPHGYQFAVGLSEDTSIYSNTDQKLTNPLRTKAFIAGKDWYFSFKPIDSHYEVYNLQWYLVATFGLIIVGLIFKLSHLQFNRTILLEKEIDISTQTLSKTNETFDTILNAFPEVLYLADMETYELIFTNAKFNELLAENPIGKKCYKAIQGFDAPCSFCTNHIIKNSLKPYIWEHYNEKLNIHFYVNDQMIEWVDGRQIRFEIAININKLKAAEKELRDTNVHLEEKVQERTRSLELSNQDLESFAYSVSHDLKAPLRHIDGFVGLLLKDEEKFDEKSTHYFQVIRESAQKMGKLIDDLLTYSRAGRFELNKQNIDLNEVGRRVLENFTDIIKKENVNFNMESLPVVYGDEGMIETVMNNYVSNALKYSQNKDDIDIGVFVEDLGDMVKIVVKDKGAGFDMEYKDKLFGVFQRLHSDQEFEGNGIGLANVKRIIHRHGGDVSAEGEVDVGATFAFTIQKGV